MRIWPVKGIAELFFCVLDTYMWLVFLPMGTPNGRNCVFRENLAEVVRSGLHGDSTTAWCSGVIEEYPNLSDQSLMTLQGWRVLGCP